MGLLRIITISFNLRQLISMQSDILNKLSKIRENQCENNPPESVNSISSTIAIAMMDYAKKK